MQCAVGEPLTAASGKCRRVAQGSWYGPRGGRPTAAAPAPFSRAPSLLAAATPSIRLSAPRARSRWYGRLSSRRGSDTGLHVVSMRANIVIRPLPALECVGLEPFEPRLRQVIAVRVIVHDPRRIARDDVVELAIDRVAGRSIRQCVRLV